MATQVTKTESSLVELAAQVLSRGRGLFQSKEMRDRIAAKLSSDGHTVSRSSVRGQQLHPEYVTDYVGTYYTGFGNTDYQTYFSVLYAIEVR